MCSPPGVVTRSGVRRSGAARPRGWRDRCRRRARRRRRRRTPAPTEYASTTGVDADDREPAADDPGRDADEPAEHREQDRLDDELADDVRPARPDRLADADLARALGDRHEHDVHHADPADEQRDRRDGAEQHRERAGWCCSSSASNDAWLRTRKSTSRRWCRMRASRTVVISFCGRVDGLRARRLHDDLAETAVPPASVSCTVVRGAIATSS